MKPTWETIAVEGVRTPQEVFHQLIAEGYHVEYSRIPMFVHVETRCWMMCVCSTDEQAPIPVVFDLLVDKCTQLLTNPATEIIFNCQMG